ncbi:hypothetical protein ACFQZ4_15610 [Catellatospora coxensis]
MNTRARRVSGSIGPCSGMASTCSSRRTVRAGQFTRKPTTSDSLSATLHPSSRERSSNMMTIIAGDRPVRTAPAARIARPVSRTGRSGRHAQRSP